MEEMNDLNDLKNRTQSDAPEPVVSFLFCGSEDAKCQISGTASTSLITLVRVVDNLEGRGGLQVSRDRSRCEIADDS